LGRALPRRAPARALLTLPVASWVLYDFANTIFSYVVLTRYFNEWIVIERRQPDWAIGVMSACVSALLVLVLPVLGAAADRSGRHKPFLVPLTLGSVAATALLGAVDEVLAALVVAGVAIFCFNAAEAQYHPLLASVAPPERRSMVSGLGVGIGYLGALVALVGLGALVADGDNQRAFLPTAALFGLFALPCLLWVRDRPGARRPGASGGRGALAELARAVGEARRRPYGRFLLARFLYVDAIATVIAFMTVYARRTGDFSGTELDALLGLSTLFAIAGALGAGVAVEHLGARRVILGTLVAVALGMLAAAITGASALLWVVGPLVGAALGSVTASDRVLLLGLLPPERRGEGFGLYALVGRLSVGFGPLVLWGGTIWLLTDVLGAASSLEASRVAVALLAGAALAGAALLRPIRDA
jgi:UMF1 family MFS transporter